MGSPKVLEWVSFLSRRNEFSQKSWAAQIAWLAGAGPTDITQIKAHLNLTVGPNEAKSQKYEEKIEEEPPARHFQ